MRSPKIKTNCFVGVTPTLLPFKQVLRFSINFKKYYQMSNQVTAKPKLKITANKLIEKRELLLNDIHEYWLRIRAENVALKTYKRKFKMTELYEQIKNMEKSVINTKCMIQAINMGFKTMEQFSNSIYPTIFELQQKQERIRQLRKIPTISPVARKKYGKNFNRTEQLSFRFRRQEIQDLEKEVLELKTKLIDFNNNASLEYEMDNDELALVA